MFTLVSDAMVHVLTNDGGRLAAVGVLFITTLQYTLSIKYHTTRIPIIDINTYFVCV